MLNSNDNTTAPVRITIEAGITIAGLPREADRAIAERCTFLNPEFTAKARMNRWTGDTPESITTYRRTDGGLWVPRGAFSMVIGICRQYGLEYRTADATVCPPLGIDITPAGALYDHQSRSLDDLLRHQTGFLVAPTGSGKTNILLSVIPRLDTTTLILTHTKGLLDQTAQRCRSWLGVEPGVIGGGRWDVRPITVAMIQTLARRGCAEIADYFGCLLIDEAHHSPCLTWAAVANQLPARHKHGVTATPFRRDGLQQLMWQTVGPITARISQVDVVAAGRILVPTIETAETGFCFDLTDSTQWGAMLTALAQDDARNDLIASNVRGRLTPNTRALVLTDRVDHVRILGERLADLDPVLLTGALSKADREAGMARVRAGAAITIATAGLLGEGVDVPGWDLLLMVSPFAGGTKTLQAVGRITRASPGKTTATVLDFLDPRVPALVNAHRKRVRDLERAS